MKQVFITGVKNHKIGVLTAQQIVKCIASHEGDRVIITIEKCSKKRSLAQNSYTHLLFSIFTDELNKLGNDFKMDEVKELCKLKFLTIDVFNAETGEVIGQRIKGSSELTTVENCEFVEKIIVWAVTFFNIKLPYPGEDLKINFDEK